MGRFLFILAISIWLGTTVSFSYIFLPVIHSQLQGPRARELLQELFPVYYAVGIVCGLIALAAVSFAPIGPTLPQVEKIKLAIPVALGVLCFAVTRQLVLPRMAGIDSAANPDAYSRLHQVAAMLNTTVVALLLLALAAVSAR